MITVTSTQGEKQDVALHTTAQEALQVLYGKTAKEAVACRVGTEIRDLSYPLTADAELEMIDVDSEEGLEILRHSCTHLMAQAMRELYPQCQLAIGPVIEHGFYYDFDLPEPLHVDELAKIERRMAQIAKRDLVVERLVMSKDEALHKFSALGEHYKCEMIKELADDVEITAYQQGDFIDLCRGPHVPRTRFLKSFKLMSIAGAYWRGDSNNKMLNRIYGTAWPNDEMLREHLERLKQAELRDHRRLAANMQLCFFDENAPGMAFWQANGWFIHRQITGYIRENLLEGYQEINTPQLLNNHLWALSGHADKFSENMYTLQQANVEYSAKPMSCPCHVLHFKHQQVSYKSLPVRYAEFGSVFRNEPSGTLFGLKRLRNFVQDDGHVFCTPEQMSSEIKTMIQQVFTCYKSFGFETILIKLSTRPEKRVGSDAVWDKSEAVLADVLKELDLDYELLPGEGAFYGPKIEFTLRDCLHRKWQCGTIQVDFSMAEKLGASYIDSESKRQVPVMIHRAILGSIERFLAILIEEYNGYLPLWLAPLPCAVIPLSPDIEDYAQQLASQLQAAGVRHHIDLRNEKIGFKIREYTKKRVQYLIIVGKKELTDNKISLRDNATGETVECTVDALIARFADSSY